MIRALAWAASFLGMAGCLVFHNGPMPGEPAKDSYTQVEGTRVRFLDVGRGPPVVLLHGFASSIENWALVIPELAKTHRVIALDLRGFGWTDRPAADYSPVAQAAMVRALVDQRGVGPAALVAHSWGSSVALAFALAYPERVTKLALYDAWVYEDQLPSMFQLARAKGVGEALFALFYSQRAEERIVHGFFDPRFITQQLVDDVEAAFARPGTKAAALATVRGMNFSALEPQYGTIKAPTLLLFGREDVVTPPSIGERLVRQLPNAKLIVYPRCGHFPMLEAAPESTRDLARFLEEP